MDTERFTRLDRSILKHVDQGILVICAIPPVEPHVHTSLIKELKHLSNLGLANELQTTMQRALREAKIDRPGVSFAIYKGEAATKPMLDR